MVYYNTINDSTKQANLLTQKTLHDTNDPAVKTNLKTSTLHTDFTTRKSNKKTHLILQILQDHNKYSHRAYTHDINKSFSST